MKKFLRTFGLAAAVAGSVGLGTTPASAQGAVGFVGTAGVDCFGCGQSSCFAEVTVDGVYARAVPPQVIIGGRGSTTVCVANEPADVTCLITGSASGHVAGDINVDFNWTRVGATALISTSGDINGNGSAAFVVTSPVGNPCGQAITADIAGSLAGT